MVGSYFDDANIGQVGLCSASNVYPRYMRFADNEAPPPAIQDPMKFFAFANTDPLQTSIPQWKKGPKYFDLADCNTYLGSSLPAQNPLQIPRGRKLVYAISVDLVKQQMTYYIKYFLPDFARDYAHRGVKSSVVSNANGMVGFRYSFDLDFVIIHQDDSQPDVWSHSFSMSVQHSNDLKLGVVSTRSTEMCSNSNVQVSLQTPPLAIYDHNHKSAYLDFTIRIAYTGLTYLGQTAGPRVFIDPDDGSFKADLSTIVVPPAIAACNGLHIIDVQRDKDAYEFCSETECVYLVHVRTADVALDQDGNDFIGCPLNSNTDPTVTGGHFDLWVTPYQCDRNAFGHFCDLNCKAMCGGGQYDELTIVVQKHVFPPNVGQFQFRAVGATMNGPSFDPEPAEDDTLLYNLACSFDDPEDACGDDATVAPVVPIRHSINDMCLLIEMQNWSLWDDPIHQLFLLVDTLLFEQATGTTHPPSIGKSMFASSPGGKVQGKTWSDFLNLFHYVPREMKFGVTPTGSVFSERSSAKLTLMPAAQRHHGMDGFCMDSRDFLKFFFKIHPDVPEDFTHDYTFDVFFAYQFSAAANSTNDEIVMDTHNRRLLGLPEETTQSSPLLPTLTVPVHGGRGRWKGWRGSGLGTTGPDKPQMKLMPVTRGSSNVVDLPDLFPPMGRRLLNTPSSAVSSSSQLHMAFTISPPDSSAKDILCPSANCFGVTPDGAAFINNGGDGQSWDRPHRGDDNSGASIALWVFFAIVIFFLIIAVLICACWTPEDEAKHHQRGWHEHDYNYYRLHASLPPPASEDVVVAAAAAPPSYIESAYGSPARQQNAPSKSVSERSSLLERSGGEAVERRTVTKTTITRNAKPPAVVGSVFGNDEDF
jgi:hypothetical protein